MNHPDSGSDEFPVPREVGDNHHQPRKATTIANRNGHNQKKKVIGIIGGSGPEAGADLFRKILATHRRRMGRLYVSDRDAPNIVLMSVAGLGGPRTAIDLIPHHPNGTYEASKDALVETLANMAPLVDVVCVACNTLHVFAPVIEQTLLSLQKSSSSMTKPTPTPDSATKCAFVSMIDATVEACKRRLSQRENDEKGAKIAVLGISATMDLRSGRSSYGRLLEQLGDSRLYIPPPPAQRLLEGIIGDIKQTGRPPSNNNNSNNTALEDYRNFLFEMRDTQSVVICVLACTELPLIDHGSLALGAAERWGAKQQATMEFLDPTEVLAETVLEATQLYPLSDRQIRDTSHDPKTDRSIHRSIESESIHQPTHNRGCATQRHG